MNSLSIRVERKLKSLIAKYIPNKLEYKPVGYYETIADYISSFENDTPKFVELYPGYSSTIDIPDEFYSRHTYPWPKNGWITPSSIVEIKNGRLVTDGVQTVAVISHDNKVIGEVSYQAGKEKTTDNAVFTQNYFSVPKKLKGVAFHILIGGAGDNNYFHWLFDALPRLHLLKKAGWFNNVDWFIVPSFKEGYQKESLKMLGIEESKIVIGHMDNHIEADILIASTHTRKHNHIPHWICNFLRDSASKALSYKDSEDSIPFFYITRADATYRQVLNEDELFGVLEEYGFKKIELGSLSFFKQVQLFSSAKVIVTPHGAGLANLTFCKSGTSVIELFSTDYISFLYYDLANKAGLNYQYLFCSSDIPATTLRKKIRQNIIVDIDKVRDMLDKIMMNYVESHENFAG